MSALLQLRYALGRWLVAPVIRLPKELALPKISRLEPSGEGTQAGACPASKRPFSTLDEDAVWLLALGLMARGEGAANAVDTAFAARSRFIGLTATPPVAGGHQK